MNNATTATVTVSLNQLARTFVFAEYQEQRLDGFTPERPSATTFDLWADELVLEPVSKAAFVAACETAADELEWLDE